ncbi:MAG: crotonobetainyl-CoA:carnitine CoA-transferase CaiB-like acyl-CoA transferase [Myxococcota bacterium]|jgi:crotonobetainyl-CoA:carnitine CoA-transferase CaiB-like acyl-CoA transferase
MSLALNGIRVIDFSTPLAEATGRILADLGAEVIKIEPPGGCAARFTAPFDTRVAGGNDCEKSLYWRMWGRGKHSVVLDVNDSADHAQVVQLINSADILIESFTPGTMAAQGLGYSDVKASNPALLYLSVTPFGQAGSYANTPATDLTLSAGGGLLNMQGDGNHAPVPVGFPETCHLGASQAAADVIGALYGRNRSGIGQHLDTSVQAAVLWTLMNTTDYAAMGQDPPGFAEDRTGRESTMPVMPGLTLPVCEPCKDGFVVMTLVLGAQGMFGFNAAMKWIGEQGGLEADLMEVDWTHWIQLLQEQKLSIEDANRGVDQFRAHLRTMTKVEIQEQAVAQKWLIAPVNLAPDLLSDRQLIARDFWVDVDGSTMPGPFARLSETPITYDRPAPKLGADQALATSTDRTPAAPTSNALSPRTGVFEGLKVADFSWVAAGPLITKELGVLGATVLRVESENRLDTLRFIPPFVGDPGITTGHMAANMNQNKKGIAIDLSTKEGLAVAHKMVEWADVVVENFTPGTAERIGLGYEQLRKIKPSIVMVYTCMRGQTGPEARHTGFGLHGAALGGFVGITGWKDTKPSAPWGAYTDFISPRFALSALSAALYHRDKTGVGQCIDISQIECSMHYLGPMILDYTTNGRVVDRAGHDSERGCPHGAYACVEKERYIAIDCQTESHWQALRSVVPELSALDGAELNGLEGRLARKDELNATLANVCSGEECFAFAQRLRSAGVPTYPVLRSSDFHEDKQLKDRGFFIELEHSGFGKSTFDGAVTIYSETPSQPTHAGPLIGEHTFEVMQDILGYSEDEISEIAAAGALS